MEGSSGGMIEQAKEDLQILEAQHPTRFEYLKHELKSFIFLLESQQILFPQDNMSQSANSISSMAPTQVSTYKYKKRKKDGNEIQEMEERRECTKLQRLDVDFKMEEAELVLERARSCLRKIQELKSSLC